MLNPEKAYIKKKLNNSPYEAWCVVDYECYWWQNRIVHQILYHLLTYIDQSGVSFSKYQHKNITSKPRKRMRYFTRKLYPMLYINSTLYLSPEINFLLRLNSFLPKLEAVDPVPSTLSFITFTLLLKDPCLLRSL